MDWLVRQLFKIKPLRIALFEEVELYNSITRIMAHTLGDIMAIVTDREYA